MHCELFMSLLVLWDSSVLCARSFVYQRDVSEHCRRRALPSVFLGKRVVQTNAQMMHFSRLELPYTCFIAVRAETGNHIILVVHLVTDDSLTSSCRDQGDQLLVYEMGETFGGYWGQVPAQVDPMWGTTTGAAPAQTTTRKFYTLKSTQQATKRTTTTTEPTTEETTRRLLPLTLPQETTVQQRVWTDIVPLLNLSMQIVPSDVKVRHRINSDDAFDAFYDVTPVPGVKYETSIVPLLQFSISALKDSRREGGSGDGAPLFDLVYSSDEELTTETSSTPHDFRNMFRKHKSIWDHASSLINHHTKKLDHFLRTIPRYYESRRVLNSTTEQRPPTFGSSSSQSLQRSDILVNKFQYNQNQLSSNDLATEAMGRNESTTKDSWLYVLNLINVLKNVTNISEVQLDKPKDKQQSVLQRKMSQMEHNKSVYLQADLDKYIKNNEATTSYAVDTKKKHTTLNQIMTLQKPSGIIPSSTKKYSITKEVDNSTSKLQNYSSTNTMRREIYLKDKLNGTSSSVLNLNASHNASIGHHFSKKEDVTESPDTTRITLFGTNSQFTPFTLKPITGALVGHESWDNVVNIAPKMEMVLNHMSPKYKSAANSTKKTKREKRDVQPVDIHDSKPHVMVHRPPTTTVSLYSETDMYGFPPIVEPRDDEIYGRVHLRYVRRYVGPAIFNLCNYTRDEPKMRQVLLFNSSRILIGISNFTIKRMTLVATSARTLESVSDRCPPHHLECQVSGARVCIDSSSACDGVPNCGAYDIYDEDRLTCGAAHDFQHNVYLAAFTFLAVLMTICYSVHYWLKRCVPKVSEAFFVYTNGAENNILFLDSIMKSPMDNDVTSKIFYHGPILEEDYLQKNIDRRSTIRKFIDRISVFFQREPDISSENRKRESRYESRKVYSFTELELNKCSFKITTDTSMQTGESMEMQTFTQQLQPKAPSPTQDTIEVSPLSYEVVQEGDLATELPEVTSMMEPKKDLRAIKLFKYLREARGTSQESPRVDGADGVTGEVCSVSDERELGNLLYDLHGYPKDSSSSLVTAHDTSIIAAPIQHQSQSPVARMSSTQKRLRFGETATVIPSAQVEADEPGQSSKSIVPPGGPRQPSDEGTGMDFIRFWNKKPKKSKNKGQVSLK